MKLNLEKLSRAVDSIHTKIVLALISFTESSVFVVPPDPLLVALVLARPKKWLRVAVFTTVWSLLGGLFGYLLGAFLYESIGAEIVALYNLGGYMERAFSAIDSGVFLFTLVMAFTPIPFKIAVLTAGVAHANITLFALAMIIGRSARYVAIAFIAKLFGNRAGEIIKKYSVTLALFGVLILALWALLTLV